MAFSTEDIVPDSPTNNFATLNPIFAFNPTLANGVGSQPANLIEGNLKSDTTLAVSSVEANMTFGTNQIWYFECYAYGDTIVGIQATPVASGQYPGVNTTLSAGLQSDGTEHNISDTGITYGNNVVVVGVCVNLINNTIQFRTSSWGNVVNLPSAMIGRTDIVPAARSARFSGDYVHFNFGQDPTFAGSKSPTTTYTDANGIGAFYYQPPTGALALCTANLPDFTPTVIDDVPQDYFKAVLYTGQTADSTFTDNGDNTWSKTGVGFQPDLVWLKERSSTSFHQVVDAVRGAGVRLEINGTGAETTPSPVGLSSFDADGFTVGNNTSSNENSQTYVAWCWKAGGAPDLTSSPTKPFAKDGVQYETLSAANITAGTITPTAMSVNTDAGFSIVTFTGDGDSSATVGHGLDQVPEFIIQKRRDTINDWQVSFKDIGVGYLNYTSAVTTGGGGSNGRLSYTGNTSTYYTWLAGSSNVDSVNAPGGTYIAYCWHSVEGYSKFGSYTGNGSPDGPFIYCGFRPAFVMVKRTDTTDHWFIIDAARSEFNVMGDLLLANSNGNEFVSDHFDFTSNGVKLRNNGAGINATNGQYIFMAFAEQPFKFSNAR